MKTSPNQGFSLVEMLLVIVLLGIFASIGISVVHGYQRNTDFMTTAQTVVATLRLAQTKSITGEGKSTWGVHLDTTKPDEHFIVLFQGADFAHAILIDQTLPLMNASRLSQIALNGEENDVVFSRRSGTTKTYGTGPNSRALCIADANDPTGCKKSIVINESGRINIE